MGPPQFGDTSLTKVFVGGLAWETQKDALRHHFEQYGDILEAVIISDKLTARSKGYGFVTFKEAEAAKKACDDPAPVINGRRANCNLASLGARRQGSKVSPPATPATAPSLQNKVVFGGSGGGPAVQGTAQLPAAWYYAGTPTQTASPHFYQQYSGGLPFYATSSAYGYSPGYVAAADLGYNTASSYNAKLNNAGLGGTYLPGHFPYHGGMTSANAMMPMYPMYQPHHLQSQSMGFPAAQFFPPAATGMVAAATPAIITKPKIVPASPTTGTNNYNVKK